MFINKAFGFNFLATAGSDNFYNSFNFYQLSYRYLPDHVLLFFLYLGKNHCSTPSATLADMLLRSTSSGSISVCSNFE